MHHPASPELASAGSYKSMLGFCSLVANQGQEATLDAPMCRDAELEYF